MEKQIEEMAKALCGKTLCGKKFINCISIGECKQSNDLAKNLFDRGYRKINENEVIISKEEYEKLKILKEGHITCKELLEFVNSARKETAREIFNALYKDTIRYGRPAVYKFLSPKDIKDMAKQYGVEIGEEV